MDPTQFSSTNSPSFVSIVQPIRSVDLPVQEKRLVTLISSDLEKFYDVPLNILKPWGNLSLPFDSGCSESKGLELYVPVNSSVLTKLLFFFDKWPRAAEQEEQEREQEIQTAWDELEQSFINPSTDEENNECLIHEIIEDLSEIYDLAEQQNIPALQMFVRRCAVKQDFQEKIDESTATALENYAIETADMPVSGVFSYKLRWEIVFQKLLSEKKFDRIGDFLDCFIKNFGVLDLQEWLIGQIPDEAFIYPVLFWIVHCPNTNSEELDQRINLALTLLECYFKDFFHDKISIAQNTLHRVLPLQPLMEMLAPHKNKELEKVPDLASASSLRFFASLFKIVDAMQTKEQFDKLFLFLKSRCPEGIKAPLLSLGERSLLFNLIFGEDTNSKHNQLNSDMYPEIPYRYQESFVMAVLLKNVVKNSLENKLAYSDIFDLIKQFCDCIYDLENERALQTLSLKFQGANVVEPDRSIVLDNLVRVLARTTNPPFKPYDLKKPVIPYPIESIFRQIFFERLSSHNSFENYMGDLNFIAYLKNELKRLRPPGPDNAEIVIPKDYFELKRGKMLPPFKDQDSQKIKDRLLSFAERYPTERSLLLPALVRVLNQSDSKNLEDDLIKDFKDLLDKIPDNFKQRRSPVPPPHFHFEPILKYLASDGKININKDPDLLNIEYFFLVATHHLNKKNKELFDETVKELLVQLKIYCDTCKGFVLDFDDFFLQLLISQDVSALRLIITISSILPKESSDKIRHSTFAARLLLGEENELIDSLKTKAIAETLVPLEQATAFLDTHSISLSDCSQNFLFSYVLNRIEEEKDRPVEKQLEKIPTEKQEIYDYAVRGLCTFLLKSCILSALHYKKEGLTDKLSPLMKKIELLKGQRLFNDVLPFILRLEVAFPSRSPNRIIPLLKYEDGLYGSRETSTYLIGKSLAGFNNKNYLLIISKIKSLKDFYAIVESFVSNSTFRTVSEHLAFFSDFPLNPSIALGILLKTSTRVRVLEPEFRSDLDLTTEINEQELSSSDKGKEKVRDEHEELSSSDKGKEKVRDEGSTVLELPKKRKRAKKPSRQNKALKLTPPLKAKENLNRRELKRKREESVGGDNINC